MGSCDLKRHELLLFQFISIQKLLPSDISNDINLTSQFDNWSV